jgi:hypothetical protein
MNINADEAGRRAGKRCHWRTSRETTAGRPQDDPMPTGKG